MKDALESRIGKRLDGECWAIQWLIKHAAAMLNRLHVQASGKRLCVKKLKAECTKGKSWNLARLSFGYL